MLEEGLFGFSIILLSLPELSNSATPNALASDTLNPHMTALFGLTKCF